MYYGTYYNMRFHKLYETPFFQVVHGLKSVLMGALHFCYVLMRGNTNSDTILNDY